jgi:hypothetical protein
MKLNLLLILLVTLLVASCGDNQRSRQVHGNYIAYRPLSSVYLLEKRSFIQSEYRNYIQPLYENEDCLLGLPSVFHKGQEFIPTGYLHYNDDNQLVRVVIVFALGNNPNVDTVGVRKKIMRQFSGGQGSRHHYSYDMSGAYKSFEYKME